MRHFLHAICSVSLINLLLCGCDLGDSHISEPQLDSSVNGKRVAYATNQSFSLDLKSNADAGYSWYLAISDSTVIHLDSTGYWPKRGDSNMLGGPTVETFYLRATKIGLCLIALDERQGWLPDVPPIHSVRFAVTVYR